MNTELVEKSDRVLQRELNVLLNRQSAGHLPKLSRESQLQEIDGILRRERWIREEPDLETRRMYRKRLHMTIADLEYKSDMADAVRQLRDLADSIP